MAVEESTTVESIPIQSIIVTLLALLGLSFPQGLKWSPIVCQEREQVSVTSSINSQALLTPELEEYLCKGVEAAQETLQLPSSLKESSSSLNEAVTLSLRLAIESFKAFQDLLSRITEILDIETTVIQENTHKLFNILCGNNNCPTSQSCIQQDRGTSQPCFLLFPSE